MRKISGTRWRLFVGEAMRQQLLTPEALEQMRTGIGGHITRLARQAAHRDEVDRGLYSDVKSYLVDNCLIKTDRMSMATSLEARVPLLDRELVELVLRMPSRLKIAGGQTKPPHSRDGYSITELKRMMAAADLQPHRQRTFSRFFTELVELALNFAYVKKMAR